MLNSIKLDSLNITPAKMNQFAKRGVEDLDSLISYIPKKYKDLRIVNNLLNVHDGDYVQFLVKINRIELKTTSTDKSMVTLFCQDIQSSYYIKIMYLHQRYMARSFLEGNEVYFAGKVTVSMYNNHKQIVIFNPETYKIKTFEDPNPIGILPVYKKIPGMSDVYLKDSIKKALKIYRPVEFHNNSIIKKYNLININDKYKWIHLPKDSEQLKQARQRFIIDDLFYFNWMLYKTSLKEIKNVGFRFEKPNLTQQIINNLSYKLTDDQQKAVIELYKTGKTGARIYSLLQGDVGTGKTVVMELFCAMNIDSGKQAVVIAPTTILAMQHYEECKNIFGQLNINVAFLNSETKKSERNKILKGLKDGSIQLLISTQSALSDEIIYKDLGCVVVDEEHRFGVNQREKLLQKYNYVHHLSMSATPIPRTLAMGLYGQAINIITINTKPANRKDIRTHIVQNRDTLYKIIKQVKDLNQQVYIVCPLIEEDEENDNNLLSVEKAVELYSNALPNIKFAAITGKTKKNEQEKIINDFKDNKIDCLIATTVIEVGVNVPNANLIIIENADRFGLAQLHQLRGRVGRSNSLKQAGMCLLYSNVNNETTAYKRLKIMEETTDGIVIAKEDLKNRGAGDFIGTTQSGDNKYINLMLAYPKINEQIKNSVIEIHNDNEQISKYDKIFLEDNK